MLKPFKHKGKIEAGCDEAGRGCLAGPVFAAAVVLPPNYKHKILNDSKKINKRNRQALRIEVERDAIAWAVGICDQNEIDEINILNASFLSMHKALDQIVGEFDFILVDGNRFTPYPEVAHECVIKGDAKFMSIAAASILAKTYRDDYMEKIALEHPAYGWDKNMGYPTKAHRNAIREHGATMHHRKSFKLLPTQLELSL